MKQKKSSASRTTRTSEQTSIPAAEALSFLKETRGLDSWKTSDLSKSLKISAAEAKQVISLLQLQGYIAPQEKEWRTTAAGEAVSGSKMPRLKRESVEEAVKHLAERIRAVNDDENAVYRE